MNCGFDISTTTCGWCISENKKIIDCGFIDISNENTFKGKAYKVINFIKNHSEYNNISRYIVEAALSGYSGGMMQKTLILLTRFNAVFCYILEEETQKELIIENAVTLRKSLFGRARERGVKSKEFVKYNIEALYEINKYIIKNKKNTPDKRNEDMYDAIVCSMYNK